MDSKGGGKEYVGSLDPTEVSKIYIPLPYLLFALQICPIRIVILPQASYKTHQIAPSTHQNIKEITLTAKRV